MSLAQPPARADLPEAQTWNIGAIFETPEAWEQEAAAFPGSLEQLKSYAGRLDASPEVLAEYLRADEIGRQRLARLTSYAVMQASVSWPSPSLHPNCWHWTRPHCTAG
jgi:oligoendopeptidase F